MLKIKNILNSTPFIIFVSLFFLLINIHFYKNEKLNGNLNNHIMSSDYFGVPEHLKIKGLETFYKDKNLVGWDGQFYYYIANDLLDLNQSSKHLDAPSYRYQRIGFGVWSFALSKLAFQDWVSPIFMLISYILLYILGIFALIKIFQHFEVPLFYSLLWPLSVMTQITIMNALPDAAADSFFFISLYCLLRRWTFPYVLFMSLCVLSREAYVLLAFFIFLWSIADSYLKKTLFKLPSILKIFSMGFPGLAFLIWQSWIRFHFKVSPSSQAHGILDWPFKSWVTEYEKGDDFKRICLWSFMLLMVYILILCFSLLKNWKKQNSDLLNRFLLLAFSGLVLLYFCFGHTVLMHWTGFLKPLPLILVFIPFFSIQIMSKTPRWIQLTLLISTICSFYLLYKERIFA